MKKNKKKPPSTENAAEQLREKTCPFILIAHKEIKKQHKQNIYQDSRND